MDAPAKRRKVRKGTKNCWQCKRRKTKCTFASVDATVCDGCRSRGTECRSQDFDDDASVIGGANVQIRGAGLQRIGPLQDHAKKAANDFEFIGFGDNDAFSKAISACWPCERDLELILSLQISTGVLTHGTLCQPYHKIFHNENLESPEDVLAPIQQTAHVVLKARRCLMLAIYLQGIPLCAPREVEQMCMSYETKMFEIATRYVTSKDDLLQHIEGIECLMLESMYLNNAGKLRRAWLVNRKAISVAQIVGVSAGKKSDDMVLEAKTWERVHPQHMWRRLIATDRYLSLILGLPAATTIALEYNPINGTYLAWDEVEAGHLRAGDLLLNTNFTSGYTTTEAEVVDDLLHSTAARMEPEWWSAPPNFDTIRKPDSEELQETLRLMMHFTHYHLLLRVQLPFLLRVSDRNVSYEYNKLVAADASRNVLRLYAAFRKNDLGPAYCRGIDFVALVAAVSLCLVHMEAQRQYAELQNGHSWPLLQSLRHQRLYDRGLLEATLEIMEKMAETSKDAIARQIAFMLNPLLDIEERSAKGQFHESAFEAKTDARVADGASGSIDGSGGLQIRIPYFGAICIQRIQRNPHNVLKETDHQLDVAFEDQTVACSDNVSTGMSGEAMRDGWVLQGVDFALFDSLGLDWTAANDASCL